MFLPKLGCKFGIRGRRDQQLLQAPSVSFPIICPFRNMQSGSEDGGGGREDGGCRRQARGRHPSGQTCTRHQTPTGWREGAPASWGAAPWLSQVPVQRELSTHWGSALTLVQPQVTSQCLASSTLQTGALLPGLQGMASLPLPLRCRAEGSPVPQALASVASLT